MIEGTESVNQGVIERLHSILRPFLLRRLKKDVEKSLPGKFEPLTPPLTPPYPPPNPPLTPSLPPNHPLTPP